MKRSFTEIGCETKIELPILPWELWDLIIRESTKDIRRSIFSYDPIDTNHLMTWIRFSMVDKTFRKYFLEKISTVDGLKEIYPSLPGVFPNVEKFTNRMTFTRSYSTTRSNITTWLHIAIQSEIYFQHSQSSLWISSIESFAKFFEPIKKYYNISEATYGNQMCKLVKRVDSKWKKLTCFKKAKIVSLTEKLFQKYKRRPLPTVKIPSENTKYGCLMVYNKEWRKDGEKNGKRGKIYSDSATNTKKLYLGAFKPLMAPQGEATTGIVRHFAFPLYNGDKLRHHNILREVNDRLSRIDSAMKEIKSLL